MMAAKLNAKFKHFSRDVKSEKHKLATLTTAVHQEQKAPPKVIEKVKYKTKIQENSYKEFVGEIVISI